VRSFDPRLRHGMAFLVCAFLLLAAPAPIHADWIFSPVIGVGFGTATGYFDPDGAAARKKRLFGAALSKLWRSWLAIEGEAVVAPGFFTGNDAGLIEDSTLTVLTANAVFYVPRINRFRPYGVVGAGAIHATSRDAAQLFPADRWQPIVTAGLGSLVALHDRLGLRADLRYLRSRRDAAASSPIGFGTDYLDFWRMSLGVTMSW
jgi:hypothetical protein